MAGRWYAVARDSTSSIPASRSAGSPTPQEARPASLNNPPSSTGRSSGISPNTRSARSTARNEYGEPTSKYSTGPMAGLYLERRPPGLVSLRRRAAASVSPITSAPAGGGATPPERPTGRGAVGRRGHAARESDGRVAGDQLHRQRGVRVLGDGLPRGVAVAAPPDAELVAAQPPGRAVAGQHAGHLGEQDVAGPVAVAVVDG